MALLTDTDIAGYHSDKNTQQMGGSQAKVKEATSTIKDFKGAELQLQLFANLYHLCGKQSHQWMPFRHNDLTRGKKYK